MSVPKVDSYMLLLPLPPPLQITAASHMTNKEKEKAGNGNVGSSADL